MDKSTKEEKKICSIDSLAGPWETWLPTYDLKEKGVFSAPQISPYCCLKSSIWVHRTSTQETLELMVSNILIIHMRKRDPERLWDLSSITQIGTGPRFRVPEFPRCSLSRIFLDNGRRGNILTFPGPWSEFLRGFPLFPKESLHRKLLKRPPTFHQKNSFLHSKQLGWCFWFFTRLRRDIALGDTTDPSAQPFGDSLQASFKSLGVQLCLCPSRWAPVLES